MALLDIGERTGVGDRLGQALGDWGGGTIEEEEVEDDGEEVGERYFPRRDGLTVLHEVCTTGEVTKVKALLNAGADIEAVLEGGGGVTPLHIAKGNEAVVKELLKAGANTEASGVNGMTPLHTASSLGYESVVKELLKAGAKMEAEDTNGNTPLFIAVAGQLVGDHNTNGVVKLLLRRLAQRGRRRED